MSHADVGFSDGGVRVEPGSVLACTVCDRAYLPQLLVMERSLRRNWPGELELLVVCLDGHAWRALSGRLGVTVLAVEDVERADPEVAATRAARGAREYAWTLKAPSCLYALSVRPQASRVLFLDADLRFLGDVSPLLNVVRDATVTLVAERAVAPEAWTSGGRRADLTVVQGERTGFYNSGTVAFSRSPEGLAALAWWRERCVEVCAAGSQRWGDQWHLNEVPDRFAGVRVIEQPGMAVAPWNGRGSHFELRNGQVLADREPVIFYHHQSLTYRRGPAARLIRWCGNDLGPITAAGSTLSLSLARYWRLPSPETKLFWRPYAVELEAELPIVLSADPDWIDCISKLGWREAAAEAASDLRWRAYKLATAVLPGRLRQALSAGRVRARRAATRLPRP